jgi:hypothetical protein
MQWDARRRTIHDPMIRIGPLRKGFADQPENTGLVCIPALWSAFQL